MMRSSFLRNICLRPDLPRVAVASSQTKITPDLTDTQTTLDLDSHADTCVLGRNCLIILDHNRPVQVHSFDPSLGYQTFQTVSGVLDYQHPVTGTKYHLVVHQAIHVPHLDRHLLCPMQCRVNDVVINECPKFLTPDPTDHTHAIIIPDPLDPSNATPPIVLPLQLQGVISYLDVCAPTRESWTSGECLRLDLTSETLTWDPYDPSYSEMETSMTDFQGHIVANSVSDRGHGFFINSITPTTTASVADITDDPNFYTILQLHVMIASLDTLAATVQF